MKITIEHYGEKTSVETTNEDLTFEEYFELIRRLSVSLYSEKTWNDWVR